MSSVWWIVGIVVVLPLAVVLALLLRQRLRASAMEAQLQQARRQFHRQREWLEARFFSLASGSGRPRGLAWVNIDFEDDVAFARDRHNGELRALVAVTIAFEAVEGGGMEDNPNVSRLRAATAVFLHRHGQWETDGRTIMNLAPRQAIEHFQHELEVVE